MAQEMNVWTRLTTESPKFFKIVTRTAISLAATATALLTAAGTIPGFSLPEIILTICKYAIVAGTAAALVSKATVNDTPPVE